MEKGVLSFNIKPQIDLSQRLDVIANQLKQHKKISEWTDEDEKTRYTKFKIISKVLIKEMIYNYNNGVPVTTLTKAYSYSYYRIKKIIKKYEEICKNKIPFITFD